MSRNLPIKMYPEGYAVAVDGSDEIVLSIECWDKITDKLIAVDDVIEVGYYGMSRYSAHGVSAEQMHEFKQYGDTL